MVFIFSMYDKVISKKDTLNECGMQTTAPCTERIERMKRCDTKRKMIKMEKMKAIYKTRANKNGMSSLKWIKQHFMVNVRK